MEKFGCERAGCFFFSHKIEKQKKKKSHTDIYSFVHHIQIYTALYSFFLKELYSFFLHREKAKAGESEKEAEQELFLRA